MPPWSGRYRWKRRCGGLFAKLKGLFRGKKPETAPEKAGRKLTAAERREIRKVIEAAKGDGKPHSAQDTLPFRQMYPDGLCRLTDTAWSRCIEFEDVNYQLAGQDDQTAIFEALCDMYNAHDASIGMELTLICRKVNRADFRKRIEIAAQGDAFDGVRALYTEMLRAQPEHGNNGMVKTKFLVLTIEAKNSKEAKARFSRIMLDALNETPQEMYVDGNILSLIVTGSKTTLNSDAEEDTYTADTENYTKLYTYDISDRSQPQLTGVVQQQGHYSTSRKNGDIVYLFTQFDPQVSDASEIDEYIPAVNGARMESSDIFLPEYQNSTSCLVISSVSTGKPDAIIDQKAVVSAAENFYVSENNIYISNTNWSSDVTMTQILKFSCQKGKIQAKGTADLKGSLNDSFSMNEYNSYLRVVLTDYSGETQKNALYVLDDAMQVCGNIGDLAEGEDIRSARFLGDIGYFVTFRNTDPLFSVDLSDPSDPKILGELKITGFSSYLHFYGENKLLGVGNEVDPETGAYTGIKLAMFDVSDPSNVKQLHKFVIKDTYDCPLFYNYKAAMIDTEKNVFGFMCDSSYMVFCYDEEKGFENVFTENLGDSYYGYSYRGLQEVRGCFIGDDFYLVGGGQIRIYDMANDYKEVGRLEL